MDDTIKVKITLERTQRIAEEFEVTPEQMKQLRDGINPFHKQMESEIESGDCEYDYAVDDAYGESIVEWS